MVILKVKSQPELTLILVTEQEIALIPSPQTPNQAHPPTRPQTDTTPYKIQHTLRKLVLYACTTNAE